MRCHCHFPRGVRRSYCGLTTARNAFEESRKVAGKSDGEEAVPVMDGDRLVRMLKGGNAAEVEDGRLMLHMGFHPFPCQAEAELIDPSVTHRSIC